MTSPPQHPTPARRRPPAGFTVVELLVTATLAMIVLMATVPRILESSRRLRLSLAAAEVSRALHLARSHAVRHSANVGVRMEVDSVTGGVSWALYRDGDGDGVRRADIAAGRDPRVGPRHRPLGHFGSAIRFGFPPVEPLRDPSGRKLHRRHDPIRFNRSDIASFGPTGTATPGSLYLTDGRDGLGCVRVTSRTGRIRVLIRDPEDGTWN